MFRAHGLRQFYPLINVLEHFFAVHLRSSQKSNPCFDGACAGIAHSRWEQGRPVRFVSIPLKLF